MLKSDIGFTAGDIYNLLKKNGAKTMKEIVSEIKADQTVIVMAIGWLAREDKIEFVQEGKKKSIRLKG